MMTSMRLNSPMGVHNSRHSTAVLGKASETTAEVARDIEDYITHVYCTDMSDESSCIARYNMQITPQRQPAQRMHGNLTRTTCRFLIFSVSSRLAHARSLFLQHEAQMGQLLALSLLCLRFEPLKQSHKPITLCKCTACARDGGQVIRQH